MCFCFRVSLFLHRWSLFPHLAVLSRGTTVWMCACTHTHTHTQRFSSSSITRIQQAARLFHSFSIFIKFLLSHFHVFIELPLSYGGDLVTNSCPTLEILQWPARFLCPRDSPGKNTGVGCHSLLQGIFPTQGSNPGLPHCRWILYHLSHHRNNYSLFQWIR